MTTFKDVTVVIDIQKATKLVDLGKPVILAKFDGPTTYENYYDAVDVSTKFGADSVVHKIAKALLNQGDSSPAEIAILTYNPTDLTTPKQAHEVLEEYFYNDFYFITADTQVEAEIKQIANVVEGKGFKIYGATVGTVAEIEALKTSAYKNTFVAFYSGVDGYLAEGLIGAVGSKDVGSVTWKFKGVSGLEPEPITEKQLKQIHSANGMAYVTKSGKPQSSDGKMLSGEWIDVIHSRDWIKVNIEAAVQNVFNTNDKVPYTNDGIMMLSLAVENVLIEAGKRGMILATDDGYAYEIITKKRDEMSQIDRENRFYDGLTFNFELAGAIHETKIFGAIKA